MKQISIISVLAALVIPAFAEETIAPVEETPITEQTESVVASDIAKQFEQPKFEKSSNPKTRFPHGLQLGVGVSPTSGLNGFVGYNNKNFDSFWAKRFGIRFDFATYSPIKTKLNKEINNTIGDDGFEIGDELKVNDFALDAKHYGAMIDFYPFGNTWFLGGWRVSGGYMAGKLDFDASIHGTKSIDGFEFELGDRKYTYTGGQMHGKAMLDWKFSGPYLGTGFDLGLFYGFKIYFDAGVVFTDKTAKLDLDVPLDGLKDITSGAPQEITGLIEEKYQEAKAKTLKDAQDDLDDYPYYPIIKLGFMYRF